jgi:hypothetical protein
MGMSISGLYYFAFILLVDVSIIQHLEVNLPACFPLNGNRHNHKPENCAEN